MYPSASGWGRGLLFSKQVPTGCAQPLLLGPATGVSHNTSRCVPSSYGVEGGGGWSWQDWTDAYVGRCCLRAVYLRRMKRLSLVPFTPQPFWNSFQFTSHLVKRVSLCGSHASKMPGTLPSYPSLFNPVFVLCHSKYLIETRRGMRQVADLKRLLSSTLHLRLHWFRLIQIETIKVTKTKWTSVPEMDSDSD